MSSSPLSLDRRSLLKRISLFAGLSPDDLDALVAYTHTRSLSAKQVVFRRGDEAGECFIILSGRCRVASRSPQGREVTFSIMDPGEVFGEVALLRDHPRSATVEAMEACDLLVLGRRDLLPLLEKEPRMALAVMRAVANRVGRLTSLVEETHFLSVPARLARKLLALASNYGSEQDGAVRIELKLSQTDLGSLVGASRESVNGLMQEWRTAGVLEHDAGIVTILNAATLERLALLVEY